MTPPAELPADYLAYPQRRQGMDNPHYGWDPVDRRKRVLLKDGAKCVATIIIPVEFFPLNPPAKPFKQPGAMVTPYPDLRHFTSRDYGNRVGVFRLLRALDAEGLRATFALNAEIAQRYRPLVDAISGAGHEIAAHGVSTAQIHHAGLSEAEETELVLAARAALPNASTWMSPARNESFRTLDLIRAAGFTACLDWEADQRPLALRTKSGPIMALPHYNELGDFKLLIERAQSEDDWADQVIEAAAYSVARHDKEGASALAFTMTPYVAGQPFRIHAVRRILNALATLNGLKVATAADCCRQFAEVS